MQYNMYMYCEGDPINGVDDEGQFKVTKEQLQNSLSIIKTSIALILAVVAILNSSTSINLSEAHSEESNSVNANKIRKTYNSIKDSPNYPTDFENVKNGTTQNKVNNMELLDELRKVEKGTWKKIYKDGYDGCGNKISIHYFQSESGKVFDVKVKFGWSN